MIDDLRPDDGLYSLPPEVRREIEKLIGDGKRIEALKLFRLHTEAGLRESKNAIDGWGDVQSFGDLPQDTRDLVRSLVPGIRDSRPVRVMRNSLSSAPGKKVDWTDIPAEARIEIERILPEGDYIGAVKVFRRHSQASLKDARDAVFEAAIEAAKQVEILE